MSTETIQFTRLHKQDEIRPIIAVCYLLMSSGLKPFTRSYEYRFKNIGCGYVEVTVITEVDTSTEEGRKCVAESRRLIAKAMCDGAAA